MKLKRIDHIERYIEIAEGFRRKGCLSNDYLHAEAADLIIHNRLYEYIDGNNAFLLVQKDGFYRLYYYLNDLSAPANLNGETLATEILFRGDLAAIASEVSYLERCGMHQHLVRDQYFARYADLSPASDESDVRVREAATLEEVKWACELFNNSFDRWTGDYLTSNWYEFLMQQHDILIAQDGQGLLLGALHQTREKGVAWISHVAVMPQARGKGVGNALLEAYIACNHVDDKSRYMLWVQRQNAAAVRMYVQKGFRPMGKSTLSLLKLG